MRIFDYGEREESSTAPASSAILTVPNVLSFLRLLALPIVYLDLTQGREGRALIILFFVSSSDWVDGYLARRLNQISELGKLLDPISDRLLVAVVGIAMIVADIVPLWVVAVLLVRDLVLLIFAAVLIAEGVPPLSVTRVGKSATFGLMVSLPAFILSRYLSDGTPGAATAWRWGAWATYAIGAVLYYISAWQYVAEGRRALAADRAREVAAEHLSSA